MVFQLAVVVLFLVVFAEASLSKLLAREVPEWFSNQFKDSWLGKLVPMPFLYWPIALGELVIAGLFVLSLLTVEFKTGVPNVYMGWGCLGAMLLFAGLCFGQRVTYDYAGAANSFYYSALSGVLWYLVSQVVI
jgi:hypothetical protein